MSAIHKCSSPSIHISIMMAVAITTLPVIDVSITIVVMNRTAVSSIIRTTTPGYSLRCIALAAVSCSYRASVIRWYVSHRISFPTSVSNTSVIIIKGSDRSRPGSGVRIIIAGASVAVIASELTGRLRIGYGNQPNGNGGYTTCF